MTSRHGTLILLALVALVALAACQKAPAVVDTAATVSAAVQATTNAQASVNATVDAVVKQTLAAQPTTTAIVRIQTTVATPAATAMPKPASATPAPTVNATTMTEEELAALIDKSVQEAVAATTAATAATTAAAADNTLTTQEVQALILAVTAAQTELYQAQALAVSYADLYAQLATDSLVALQAIEQDVNSMATSMASMATSLAQISQTQAQGLALAQSTISQLSATAAAATASAQAAQTQVKKYTATVKGEVDKRATTALATKPNAIPSDLRGTSQSVSTYLDTVRAALGDSKLNKNELSSISQAGANAVAGLNAHGGGQFQGLANSINATTGQLARGEAPKAKASLSSLDASARSLSSLSIGGGAPAGGLRK